MEPGKNELLVMAKWAVDTGDETLYQFVTADNWRAWLDPARELVRETYKTEAERDARLLGLQMREGGSMGDEMNAAYVRAAAKRCARMSRKENAR